MRLVYENTFAKAFADEQRQIFFWRWTPKTYNMSEQHYQNTVLEGQKRFLSLPHLNKIVIDSRQLRYIISPQQQEWYLNLITPICIRRSIGKIAVLLSDDFIISLVSELIVIDSVENQLPFVIQTFTNEETALDWLLAEALC